MKLGPTTLDLGVPPRDEWPDAPTRSEAGDLLTDVVLTIFRVNASLLDAAQGLAAAGGLTAAWWQVLGAIIDEPRSVAEIGRRMGLSRQAVLRVADLLVGDHLAEYQVNPAHKRAKLLACTEAGYWSIRRVALVQRPWADRIAAQLDRDQLLRVRSTLEDLLALLETDQVRRC